MINSSVGKFVTSFDGGVHLTLTHIQVGINRRIGQSQVILFVIAYIFVFFFALIFVFVFVFVFVSVSQLSCLCSGIGFIGRFGDRSHP